MQNWRQITHDAKDILTVCLAKAIDQALTIRLGPGWFADFAQDDAKEKVNARITKPGQQSPQDMDLQALLKFLRYRSNLTHQVLTHYGFFENMDSFAMDDQLRQLNGLLDRLINDFRNRIEAHSRAADIEKELSGQGLQRIYGYEEAYKDMLKLTYIFKAVTDTLGVSYYDRMDALAAEEKSKPQKRRLPLILGLSIAAVLIAALLLWLLPSSKSSNVYTNQEALVMRQGEVDIRPTKVYYKGSSLVAECKILNGTDSTITYIEIPEFHLMLSDGTALASASFSALENLQIAPGETISWKFTFPKDSVFLSNAKLVDLKYSIHNRFH